MSENNVLPVILAGGKSRRFGGNKANAKLGDLTLIEHTIQKLKNRFKEILIISNEERNKDISNVFYSNDVMDGQLGPLVGVLSSMEWIIDNSKNYKWIMTFPCDTPFFKIEIIDQMMTAQRQSSKKLFFLKSGEKRHNIFGLWSAELKDQLKKDLEAGERKVEDWANKMDADILEIKEDKKNNFLNINSLEELKKAEKFYE